MSTSTERPTLPKGWEWDTGARYAERFTRQFLLNVAKIADGKWFWGASVKSESENIMRVGCGDDAPDASSAAAAAERAVVEWARGLIREVEG